MRNHLFDYPSRTDGANGEVYIGNQACYNPNLKLILGQPALTACLNSDLLLPWLCLLSDTIDTVTHLAIETSACRIIAPRIWSTGKIQTHSMSRIQILLVNCVRHRLAHPARITSSATAHNLLGLGSSHPTH